MKIELEEHGENLWTVRCDDRWNDKLCTDEALWCVASILCTGAAKFLMTTEEHEARERRMAEIFPEKEQS